MVRIIDGVQVRIRDRVRVWGGISIRVRTEVRIRAGHVSKLAAVSK